MNASQTTQDEQELVAINITIGQAEKWAAQPWAIKFLEYALADDFRFMRVTGEEVNKQDYLQALTSGQRTYQSLDSDDVNVELANDSAEVTLRVTTTGHNQGNLVEGQFRNHRKYEKRQGRWLLIDWYNTRI